MPVITSGDGGVGSARSPELLRVDSFLSVGYKINGPPMAARYAISR
ncbi:hypothetical protein AXX16_1691 [Serratia rubidaea]|nr:hypothetical protein AXX16_1691 [Serratia rubidaea]